PLQEHGGVAATMFWPGSEAPVAGRHPTHWLPFDGDMGARDRVAQVLEWLDLPRRPQLLTLYFAKGDHDGHGRGPHSPEAPAARPKVADALAAPLDGADARDRVAQVLEWLDLPRRPQLLTLYFDKVDHDGHGHGPHSPEALAAQRKVDDALAALLDGLEARGLRDSVDIIIVSDHGMAEVP